MSKDGRDPCTILQPPEISAVIIQSLAFHGAARADGGDPYKVAVKDNNLTIDEQCWIKQAHGHLGEHVVAKYLGRFWQPLYVKGKKLPDLGTLGQVRATDVIPGHLIFFQNEKNGDGDQDEHAFIFVTLETLSAGFDEPDQHTIRAIIRGWLWGHEVKSSGIRDKYPVPAARKRGRTSWWAAANDLRHISWLPGDVWQTKTQEEINLWTTVR